MTAGRRYALGLLLVALLAAAMTVLLPAVVRREARFALLLALVPALGLRADGLLIPLALLLMVFVLLEGVVLMVQHSRVETR